MNLLEDCMSGTNASDIKKTYCICIRDQTHRKERTELTNKSSKKDDSIWN